MEIIPFNHPRFRIFNWEKVPSRRVASKLCVLYGAHNNQLKAYALACYGAPQLLYLNESALKLIDDDVAESVFFTLQSTYCQ